MQLQNGPERKYNLIVVRCLAAGEQASKQAASSSLLLAFASMVILGVEPHRDP
jgi:hypothetical protein